MYDSFYQLKRCNQSKRACLIPRALFHDWKMRREVPHSISFGTKIKYCQFFGHQKEHEILVSNDIWWLLEALSKPNRLTARHPKHVQVGKYTKELLMDYALFLSKNSITNPETSFPSISLERKRGS